MADSEVSRLKPHVPQRASSCPELLNVALWKQPGPTPAASPHSPSVCSLMPSPLAGLGFRTVHVLSTRPPPGLPASCADGSDIPVPPSPDAQGEPLYVSTVRGDLRERAGTHTALIAPALVQ